MQSAADAKAAYAKQQWEETVASRTQMEQSRRAAAGAAREEGERLALLARRNAEESLARDAREVVGQRERTIEVDPLQNRHIFRTSALRHLLILDDFLPFAIFL